MRSHARVSLLALVIGVLVAAAVPAAANAAFGVEKFFAANCNSASETCGEGAVSPTPKEAEEKGYTTAGGFVPYGVTDFVLDNVEISAGVKVPLESVKELRTDVAPGVVTNPQAVTKCSMQDFTATALVPSKGFYSEPTCPASSVIGVNKVVTAIEDPEGSKNYIDVPLEGKVYNLEQPYGLASDFGVALDVSALAGEPAGTLFAHTLIEGSVEWLTDYHDYFKIKNITPGLISSRLIFFGDTAGTKGFLRNASKCVKPGPETTTSISAVSYGGALGGNSYESPVGTKDCTSEPFEPSFSLSPETTVSDSPDGITAELTMPHAGDVTAQDSSDLEDATITLPKGLTINPSSVAALEACSPEQFGLATKSTDVKCPAASQIGTVELEVPTLPQQSLRGSIFLGNGGETTITKPPYKIYVDAESARYGVKVRVEGTVSPNAETGQLTTTFVNNPQAPFSSIALHLKGGAFAPVANPLACGAAEATTELTAWSGSAKKFPASGFTVENCATSFAPTQASTIEPAQAGANSTFTFSLERPQGQGYVQSVKTVLPSGLLGTIPGVTQCTEAQANAGACPAASQVGVVSVSVGSGTPYTLGGKVYLIGNYQGAPYGLSIVVPAAAGPFNFGNVVTNAKIEVNPLTAQLTISATLPTMVNSSGVPIRLRALTVTINRQGFERNPTSCGAGTIESTVTSTAGASATVPSKIQPENCGSLAFKPTFTASTSGKPSKANGASLVTTITQPAGQATIKSVVVTLPKQLPSRLSTLNKACLAATFEANPASCPAGSKVGTATAVTPVLPGTMKGLAYFVSHGGAAFPDLDLVLEGANGVRVILVGNTNIKNGITTTTFATTPDVPVSSITVNLPLASNSALAANGSLCAPTLTMPTTITAQNGKTFKQNTVIAPTGCGVQIVGHKVIGNTAYLTVKTFAAGRISGTGSGLSSTYRTLGAASKAATLKVPLSSRGRARRRPFKVKLRVGFVPKKGAHSAATVTVTFR